MGKYEKILVAFDGSVTSQHALKEAIKFAQKEQAWLKVVSVVPSYEGDLEFIGVSNIEQVLKGPGEKLVSEAKAIAESEGVSIRANLERGVAYEKIIDVADTENCDLIVMGRRGVLRLDKVLMGSVTARVIGHTFKDVLVVPRETHISWKSILLPVDGSKYSEAAIERAIDLGASYGSNLTAISVVDVTDEFYAQAPYAVDKLINNAKTILENVVKKAEASDIKVETFVKEGETYVKIVELAKEKKANVICMGSHGRTGLMKLLMGSVTEKVIGYTPCPVLVVKEQTKQRL